MTLTAFLLARIAEDEDAARLADGDTPWPQYVRDYAFDHDMVLRFSPSRVLAECEAKRRIVDWLTDALATKVAADPDPKMVWGGDQYLRAMVLVVQALAAAYRDHPEFREEWGR